MTDKLKTYSIVLNWNDRDSEEGTFGTTVRAAGHDEAVLKARAEMRMHYAEQYGLSKEEEEELPPAEEYGGMVVECSEGAIWKAKELEEALRLALPALIAVYGEPTMPEPLPTENVAGRAAILKAREIIAEIDGIDAESATDPAAWTAKEVLDVFKPIPAEEAALLREFL